MDARLLSRQLGLLGRGEGFRLLFLATLGSGFGTWLAVIALTVDVYDRTHSGSWVSALLMADFLPAIAIGLLLGPLVDRLSRRGLMIGSDLARFAIFCALPFAGSAGAIVGLAFAAGVATGFFRPAVYAGLPNLVDDADLPQANAMLRLADFVTGTIGPAVGGALAAAAGPHASYWLNAATFVVSALLLARIPPRLLQAARERGAGHWHELAEGFRLVLGSRALLTVLVSWSVLTLSTAGVNVAEVVLAKVSFSSGDFGFGLLFAGFGLGLAIGSVSAGGALARTTLARVYGTGMLLMAIGIGAAAASPDVWVATACVVVAGVGNGAAAVCNALLVQRGAPDRLRGRAFTVVMSTNFAFLGAGMIAAGPLTNVFGARAIWAGAAVVAALAAGIGYALAHGVAVGAGARTEPLPTLPDDATPQPEERTL